ncbi:MAG: type II toxin-antitoxin system HicB family antitoxin [Oscillospiraceae bacterium]|jgi:predicted RNase H-like HicB family nuclease|nr:type II toxin-antitoxin system HicB family antitoxin [Oscillospiraceae bacterium]
MNKLNCYPDNYIYPAIFTYYDDGEIGVTFPDLPGCVGQGSVRLDALSMADEGLRLHLYGMEEDGDVIPPPTPPGQIVVELDEDDIGVVKTEVVLIEVYMPPVREHFRAYNDAQSACAAQYAERHTEKNIHLQEN